MTMSDIIIRMSNKRSLRDCFGADSAAAPPVHAWESILAMEDIL